MQTGEPIMAQVATLRLQQLLNERNYLGILDFLSSNDAICAYVKQRAKMTRDEEQAILDEWTAKKINMDPWTVPFYNSEHNICLRLNHPKGIGCRKPTCKFAHICMLCGKGGHGVFSETKEGEFVCKRSQLYEEQAAHIQKGLDIVQKLSNGACEIKKTSQLVAKMIEAVRDKYSAAH